MEAALGRGGAVRGGGGGHGKFGLSELGWRAWETGAGQERSTI